MSSVLRKKSTIINDKEDKKKIKISEKSSSIDHEVKKQGISKISENVLRKKSKDIDSVVKAKLVVPSTSRKIISNSIKSNNTEVHQRVKNESTPLKANHQVNINVKNLTVKKKNPKIEPKQLAAKQRTQNVTTKNRELSNDKIASPKVLTSVTINSPKQKRKELPLNLFTQNPVSPRDFNVQNSKLNSVIGKSLDNEKFDLPSNNHKRYRTRTLDPEEVKVIDKLVPNIDYEVSQSKSNVNRNLIAQPKTFFISLDEKEKPKIHNLKQETTEVSNCDKSDPPDPQESCESLSYEDDFESYESDFESDNSSNGSHTSTSSGPEEVSSTSSNLNSTNNDLQIRAKLDDDKKFDSGNYELGELQKLAESKPLDKIIEINCSNLKNEPVPQPLTSWTDEGFDENSAGLSSSINNISNTSKVNVSAKKTAFAQRAKDLRELIVLDDVKYTLFEMFPMNYDTFIMIHGKSNMNQVTCQTNGDYIDQDVQTDLVTTDTKWTQNPIKFSKHIIVNYENASNSNSNYDVKSKNVDMNYSALEVYVSQKLGCGSSTLFTHKEIRDKIHSAHRASFVKLTKFIHKAGRVVLNFFNERERFVEDKTANISSNENKHNYKNEDNVIYDVIKKYPLQNIHFTDTNTVLTVHSAAKKNSVHLETLICVWLLRNGALEPSKILSTIGNVKCCTASGGLSGLVVAGLSDGNISAWNLKEQDIWFDSLDEPAAREDRPFRICSYHSGFDVCKVSSQKRHLWGASVDVLFSKSTLGDSSFGNVSKNQQVYLLQEFGLLTTWIVVNKPPGYKNIADMDYYHTHWSTISLVKTNAVDLNSFIHSNMNNYNEGFMKRKATKLNDKMIGNIPNKEKLNNESNKGIARAFTDDSNINFDYDITGKQVKLLQDKNMNVSPSVINWENGILCSIMKEHLNMKSMLIACKSNHILNYSPSNIKKSTNVYSCADEGSSVTCIETCPSNLPYFVVGCDSSNAIHLYADKSTRPLRNFYLDQSNTHIQSNKKFTDKLYDVFNFADINIEIVQNGNRSFWVDWVKTSPHMFFTFFRDGRVVLLDLFNSDVLPKLYYDYANNNGNGDKYLLNGKVLSPMNDGNPNTNKYLMMLHLSSSEMQIHKLNSKNFEMKFQSKKEELDILNTYFELL